MRWHVHGSYLCSDSPPVLSGSLLMVSAADPEATIQVSFWSPRLLPLSEKKWYLKVDFWLLCFSLWHSMLVYREAWQSERSRGA